MWLDDDDVDIESHENTWYSFKEPLKPFYAFIMCSDDTTNTLVGGGGVFLFISHFILGYVLFR